MPTDVPYLIPGILLALASLPGSLELAWLTLGGVLPPRQRTGAAVPPEAAPRYCFVVPAHDEEDGIVGCVGSLLACAAGGYRMSVVVIADNCEDETASRAERAGARVLIRRDARKRGKGQALAFAFERLLREDHDVFVVVDADTRVESSLLAAMTPLFVAGADAVQCRYLAANPDVSPRTRLMHVAWLAYNILRLRGREYWGCSVGILGNGFALSRAALASVPFDADSIAEDLDYHIRFVRAGRRVRYCAATTVRAPAPASGAVASSQRARWEGGRFRLIRERLPELLRGVARGETRLLEPALDLMLLPLAFHVLLLLPLLAMPWPPVRWAGLTGLAVVGCHVAAALWTERADHRYWLALASAPFYVLWKLTLGKRLLAAARRNAAWIRTER